MLADEDMRRAVARLIEAKLVGTPGFVSRTGARGFLPLTSGRSRVVGGLATIGPMTGGLRFGAGGRLIVIERGDAGYRVLVRAMVAGFPLVLYDNIHVDPESIAPALLGVLAVARS